MLVSEDAQIRLICLPHRRFGDSAVTLLPVRRFGDAGGGDHPAGGGQPVAGGRPVEFLPGDAALRPDGPPRRVDAYALHRGEVDHQATVGDGKAGDAVAAAAHGDLGCLLAPYVHRIRNVGDGAAPGDQRGALVDHAVVHPAGLLPVSPSLTGTTSPRRAASPARARTQPSDPAHPRRWRWSCVSWVRSPR